MPVTWEAPNAPIFESVSTDDPLWTSKASLGQIRSLLIDPQRWIQEVSAARTSGDAITLLPNFAVRLNLSATRAPSGARGVPFVVQGIAGTNILTIRACEGAANIANSDWEIYWNDWETVADFDVTISVDSNVGYSHMELTSTADTPFIRADKIAAFLTWAADPTKVDANGSLYINRLLRRTPSHLTRIINGVASAVTPTGPKFIEITPASAISGVAFTLVGNVADFASSDDPTPPTPPPACENMAGVLDANEMVHLDDVIVKNYAI